MIKISTDVFSDIPFKAWTFPAGERGFEMRQVISNTFYIKCFWKGSDDLIDIMNAVDAIRHSNPSAKIILDIPYFPFGRQDRSTTTGTPNSLKAFASVINSLKFECVKTKDPHSDVVAAVVDRLIYDRQKVDHFIADIVNCIVAPDAGALKKIYTVAAEDFEATPDIVTANKKRDPKTGKITQTTISESDIPFLKGNVLVVDDICDGGATFIELAKVIKNVAPEATLHLYATHGLFTKGKDLLKQYYETISYQTDFSVL